jgi:DUF1680 family protein
MTTYTPIPFPSVTINDDFWSPRQRTNRKCTLPIEYQQCKDTGRIDAFRLNWKVGQPNPPHIFWDSDVAKWIEAAAYSLATHPDPALDTLLDEVITLITAAQQPDGYLNVHFTVVEPEKRWSNLRDWHELYCAGHLIEAAVAHYQATGKRSLLDVLCRYADYITSVFGTGAGQKRGYCGHEEIELALVKLGRVTGNAKYFDQARYFVDERGRQPYYYDQEALARGDDPDKFWAARGLPAELRYSYLQAHLPVREQREVTGHAVRAMYLYCAMTDLAGETGDENLLTALHTLWEDVCTRKLYLTGGIGPSAHNEGFTNPYDLPNETAYAETCAAIGLVFWNHRMLQLDCDRRYADVMERALYNGVISGVSLDGMKFFYENPLASLGNHHRQAWFDCACCPPNLARIIASLGEYIYSQSDTDLAVHLYVQGSATTRLGDQAITIHQETRYPWDGEVNITLEMDTPANFGVKLRLPGWCRSTHLSVNGSSISLQAGETTHNSQGGYLRLVRTWKTGDNIRFVMDMPVERVYAHPDVRQDSGMVALQRGPLVYCLEQVDNPIPLQHISLPQDAELTAQFDPDLLGGMVSIHGPALAVDTLDWEGTLYSTAPASLIPCTLTAIPYFAWDNRQPGAMRVWLNEK